MVLSETNLIDVRRWEYPRQGRITQTVRAPHVDITVQLGRAAVRLWSTLVVTAGIGVLFIAFRIVEAFLSGRVQQILAAASRAH